MAYDAEYYKRWREANRDSLREKRKKYYAENKSQMAARNKVWREANKEALKTRRRKPDPQKQRLAFVKHKYGIKEERYKAMLEARGPLCPTCNEESIPYVDHCHKTGMIRGLICNSCNLILGRARDNPDVLRALASYLEAGRTA